MNNFELLLQTLNSSPDGIKFVLIVCLTLCFLSLILGPIGLGAYVFLRNRELSFQMKEQTILGKAALKDYEMFRRVILQQQELLAVPDVDAEMYNLPDCPIPVVKSLHSMSGEWSEEMREAYQKPTPTPQTPEPTQPPPFPYTNDGGNGDDSDDDNDENAGNPKNRKAVKAGKTP